MRIRSTKPEFWRSKTIAQLDFFTRLVLKALESYVDDNGVGKDSVTLFCADAFPHDIEKSPEIFAKVSGSLARLSELGLIVRYTALGEDLVYVRYWRKWQYIDKPKQGRYPRPDGTWNYRQPVDETIDAGHAVEPGPRPEAEPQPPENRAKTSRKPRAVRPQIQSGEQRNRGTEDDDAREPETAPPQRINEPSSSSSSIIDEALGLDAYPAGPRRRLAKQIDLLTAEGHSREILVATVTEWYDRPNCDKPEYLPTVLGDVIKAARSGKPVSRASDPERARARKCPDCAGSGYVLGDDEIAVPCTHPAVPGDDERKQA